MDFRAAPTDLDARVNYPEKDWNDETCALIKVQTTLKGLSFDTGTITPTKVVQRQGECWVYISPKIFKFAILHDDYTPLRYELPMSVESACTYYLTLNVIAPQNSGHYVHTAALSSGFLKLNIEPDDESHTVYIGRTRDYELSIDVASDGVYIKQLDFGKYYYKVESKYYETQYGEVDFNEGVDHIDVKLSPAYNTINISSSPEQGADVFVNGEYMGKTPLNCPDKFAKGDLHIRLTHNAYVALQRDEILPGDGQLKLLNYQMEPKYGVLSLQTHSDASIYIDNEYKAKGSWQGRLPSDVAHKVEARMDNHYAQSRSISLGRGENRTIVIPDPVPRIATLRIESSPAMAKVYMDGEYLGTSPLMKHVIMGTHEIQLSKDGHKTVTSQVRLEEKETKTVTLSLEKIGASTSTATSSSGTARTQTSTGVSPSATPSHPELGYDRSVVSSRRLGNPSELDCTRLKVGSESTPKTWRGTGLEQSVSLAGGLAKGSGLRDGVHTSKVPFTLHYNIGYRYKRFYVGAVIGATCHKTKMWMYFEEPLGTVYRVNANNLNLDLGAKVKLYFLKHDKKVNPFLSTAVGYSMGGESAYHEEDLGGSQDYTIAAYMNSTHPFVLAEFGLDFKLKGKTGLYVSGGYQMRETSHISSIGLQEMSGSTYASSFLLHGITFNVGFRF